MQCLSEAGYGGNYQGHEAVLKTVVGKLLVVAKTLCVLVRAWVQIVGQIQNKAYKRFIKWCCRQIRQKVGSGRASPLTIAR